MIAEERRRARLTGIEHATNAHPTAAYELLSNDEREGLARILHCLPDSGSHH
jgi:hypothetical protein